MYLCGIIVWNHNDSLGPKLYEDLEKGQIVGEIIMSTIS